MSAGSAIEREAQFGFLPTTRKDRAFGLWDYLAIQVGFGIAAWCFLVGGLTGTVLDARSSIPVILVGNALPVFLIAPLALLFTRYGVDTFVGVRAALGYRGADLFFLVFAILNLGWITIATFLLGQSAIRVMGEIGAPEFLTTETEGAPIFAIAAFFLALAIAFRGPLMIRWFVRIGVPSMFVILLGLIAYVLVVEGVDKLFAAQPAEPYDETRRSVASALEWNVGLGFSWLPYLGQWCRLAKSEKTAMYGSFLGWGVLLNVAAIFGAFTALLIGSLEPTDWMVAAGGVGLGLVGLGFMILANLTSAVILIYSQALSVKTIFPNWRWSWACATTLPAVVLMSSPAFYNSYSTFLAYISFIMAAVAGVLMVDYFLLRRQQLSLRELYNRGGAYNHTSGFNLVALGCIVLGGLFYFWTYNPVDDVAGPLFTYISAGIPTFFLTGFLYYLVGIVILGRQRQRGAQLAPTAS
jgi:nucleobase:cation symporter-1, NCS1 family